jgi:hypothetical protein
MAVSAEFADRLSDAATMQASAPGLPITTGRARSAKSCFLEGKRASPSPCKRPYLALRIDRVIQVPSVPCLIANLFW